MKFHRPHHALWIGALWITALAASACGSDRDPGNTGGRPKPRDAEVTCECDQNANACDPGCACDPMCGTGFPDAGTMGNPDAIVMMGNPDATTIGMDRVGCGHNPNNCGPNDLIDPNTCACIPPMGRDAGTMSRPDAIVMLQDVGSPTTDMFDPVTRANEMATANCNYWQRCEPVRFQVDPSFNMANCVQTVKPGLESYYQAMSNAIQAGTVGFSLSSFTACLARYNMGGVACGQELPGAGPCLAIFGGTRVANHPCNDTPECAADFWCTAGWAQCGSCQPRLGAMQMDCTQDAPCQRGLTCALTAQNGPGICLPRVAPGGQCGAQYGLCPGHQDCIAASAMATSGTCTSPAMGTCNFQNAQMGLAPDCDIYNNLVCAMDNTCKQVTWGGLMAMCATQTNPNPEQQCNAAHSCDTAQSRCVALPGQGQQCNQGECAMGLTCQGTTCMTALQSGATCQDDSECADPFYCISQRCQPYQWQLCN